MFKPKSRHKVVLLFCLVVVALGIAALAMASPAVRPANPYMDYVPQDRGIYDTYYCNFREPDCRQCHGTSTAERHHGTEWALQNPPDCLHCHSIVDGIVPPERDCKECHIDGGPIGDLGYPHHNSDLADSLQCEQCHDPNLIRAYSLEGIPNYDPSSITPTPYSCENCHWPSGKVPDQAAVYWKNPAPLPAYLASTALFLTDWTAWLGRPKPSYVVDPLDPNYGLPDPQPIEANGDVNNFVAKHPSKPYMPSWGLHHDIDGKVRPKCWACHGTDPVINPDDPINIRYCERCHKTDTLHQNIPEHVTVGHNYTVGGVLNQTVTANEKCDACHGDNLPQLPPQPAVAPFILTLEPKWGPPDMVVTLYDNCPGGGCGTFGPQQSGDRIQLGTGSPITWMDVPIYAWSEDVLQFRVPDWLDPDVTKTINAKVRVYKAGPTPNSNITNFTVRPHPIITSLNPSSGTFGINVQINGSGFGVRQESIDGATGYGYSSYVELHASNDIYRITKYPTGLNAVNPVWTKSKITIKLKNILDTKTKLAVPPEQLYQGCWNVKVITDYFKDNLTLGTPGSYNLGMLGLDSKDTLLYREIGEPTCYLVSATPFINCVRPAKVRKGTYATITGASFGPIRKTSYVRIGPASARIEITDGIGDDDGICDPGEVCTLDPLNPAVKIVTTYSLWSNTSIKFKVPGPPGARFVQVVVPGAAPQPTDSNLYKIQVKL